MEVTKIAQTSTDVAEQVIIKYSDGREVVVNEDFILFAVDERTAQGFTTMVEVNANSGLTYEILVNSIVGFLQQAAGMEDVSHE